LAPSIGGRSPAGAIGAERDGTTGQRLLRGQSFAERRAVQPDALFRVDTDERLVALTFDDGPDPAFTPKVLDLLHQRGARATFFLVGVNARAYPDLVARQLDAAHTVGNHTFDHAPLELLDERAVLDEVERGKEAIAASGAPPPHLFRPPRGFTDQAVGRAAATAGRSHTVFWDLCVERFVHHAGVDAGVDGLLEMVRPGSIILAHDGGHVLATGRPTLDRSATLLALPRLLAGLERLRLGVVDVPTLVRLSRQHASVRREPAPVMPV
jgi:chitooligosaccharide deacetylase